MGVKRPLSPDAPVRSFPTPNIGDSVVVLDIDSRLPGYKVLEYGSLHPDQARFPGAKLVFQQPLDGVDQFVRRIYANDRVDQDTYNYAVKYSSGSPGHPLYIRSYVELRSKYLALPEGTVDSDFPDAFLVEEEMQPIEGELNSLYVRVTRVFETLPGPVVTSFDTNEIGQTVTVTKQRKSSSGYTLPAATAISSPSAASEDVGVLEETIRSLPGVFNRKQFSAERPDPLPTKFRAAVPDVETSEIVAGQASQPALTVPEDLSASESQETLFLKKVSRRLRPDPVYPVVFEETTRTASGQLAVTTSTLQDFIQESDVGSLIESSQVTDLGDGRSIKVTTSVDEVFEQPSFTRSKEDLTPRKFLASVSQTTEERTVSGEAAMPGILEADEFSKTEEQLTADRKRVRLQQRGIVTEDTLVEQLVTPEGLLATRTLTLSDSAQAVTPAATLLQGEVEQLGDGRSVKTEVTVDAIFANKVFSKEKPDTVPAAFRAEKPETVVELTEAGTAAAIGLLSSSQLSKTEQQLTEFTKRTRTVSRDLTTNAVLRGEEIGADGIKVVVTRTLSSGAQTVNPSATVSGEVEAIGDGKTVKTELNKAKLFDNQITSIEKPDPAPEKFRVELPALTTQSIVAGQAAKTLTLAGNDLSKREESVTSFTKRTTLVSRQGTPSGTLSGQKQSVWGLETVKETYSSTGTISPAHRTMRSEVTPLGGGKFYNVTATVSPVTLTERKYDASLKVTLTTTKELVPTNTQPETTSLGESEVISLDAWNSVLISTRLSGVPQMEVYNTLFDVSYPDELLAIGILWELARGGAAGSGGARNIQRTVRDRIPWEASVDAQAYAEISGGLYTEVKQGFRGRARCEVRRTYHNGPPILLPSIRTFRPVNGTVTISGASLNYSARGSVSGRGDVQTVQSNSFREGSKVFTNSIQFGPVVHRGVRLANERPPDSGEVTYNASAGSLPGGGSYPVTTARARSRAKATLNLPQSDQPPSSSTRHVVAVNVEKWRFGLYIVETFTAEHP